MASRKRKFSATTEMDSKFYAVQAGHRPGVYLTWKECQDNITGFKGASFKKFFTQQDAEDFVAGKVVKSAHTIDEPPKFYGVAVGHVPGVYQDWSEAQVQIKDVKGPKYKRFDTRAEAEAFVKSGGKKAVAETKMAPAAKRVKVNNKDGWVTAHTDGSSRGNGQVGACAGVGVFFGNRDPRNVSERLAGLPQTNQRAELTAVLRALQIAPKNKHLEIISDSNYSIKCATEWYKNWIRHDWKTSTGKNVENKDLVKGIRDLIDMRDGAGLQTKFTWVKGHSNDLGNEAADRLAVAGSMMPAR